MLIPFEIYARYVKRQICMLQTGLLDYLGFQKRTFPGHCIELQVMINLLVSKDEKELKISKTSVFAIIFGIL